MMAALVNEIKQNVPGMIGACLMAKNGKKSINQCDIQLSRVACLISLSNDLSKRVKQAQGRAIIIQFVAK